MEELATFKDIIEGVEYRLGQMAANCVGAVRPYESGWYWQEGGEHYWYVPQFFADASLSQEAGSDMKKVRIVQALTLGTDGSAIGKRYYFDDEGLLTVLGVRLDAEQFAGEESSQLVNEVQALEMEVFGIPEVTDEDEARFYTILDSALTE